jgi:putative nucleotidyltransferase with HDIG domain
VERIKALILNNFERILAGIILVVAMFGTYFLEMTTVVMHFYFLPVLVAGYFIGRRSGVLAALLSILAVIFCSVVFPHRLFTGNHYSEGIAQICSWGGFLILASVTVGSLYETKEQQFRDLKNAYVGVLEILSKYLESTDPYTKGHSLRVSELAAEIATQMNVPETEVDNIRVAGLLHDIGKIEISGDVLRKAAELSASEREYLDSHAEKGARLLSSVGPVLKEVVPIVLAHHRYFTSTCDSDSDTVPPSIPLGARIVAVADSFDAMTTDRPYRRAIPPWEALKEIAENAARQFDPAVVDAFRQVVTRRLEAM